MSRLFGVVNVIKPPGMSSFQVVAYTRKKLDCRKAGHTGTLDPAACGVLPVCVGRATKIIPYLDENKKEYIAEMTLGIITDTLDAEGEILEKNDNWKNITDENIKNVFKKYKGKIEQLPPMYSAVHHNGKRLYKIARKGKKVERDPRQIEIFQMDILSITLPSIRFRVVCSKGTYIRSLASDIGTDLNTGAHLSFLIRTKSGPFKLENGVIIENINNDKQNIIKPETVLNYPVVNITKSSEKKARHGVYLKQKDIKNNIKKYELNQKVLVLDTNNKFYSINEITVNKKGNTICKPLRVFVN
ncbi:MAG: tRNA pseudouridine(55) synthase TruB [Halanaerobiales bacterium]